jgi:hypothetical protein
LLELAEVDPAATGVQAVAPGQGDEDVLGGDVRLAARGQRRTDELPQLEHVRLQGGAGAARRLVVPQLLDQGGDLDHPVGVQGEQRQYLTRLRGGRCDRDAVLAY